MDRQKGLNILIFFSFLVSGPWALGQDAHYIATNLKVNITVLDNLEQEEVFTGRFDLTNTGQDEINQGDWSIFFCWIRLLEPQTLPTSGGAPLGSSGLQLYHVTGCLYELKPTNEFKGIAPGNTLELPFSSSDWMVSRRDALPRWYVTEESNPETVKIISSSADTENVNFVTKFTQEKQWKRTNYDTYNPYTPEQRYDLFTRGGNKESVRDTIVQVLPTPVEGRIESGDAIELTDEWVVVAPDELKTEGQYLADKLEIFMKDPNSTQSDKVINLIQKEAEDIVLPSICNTPATKSEGYVLNIQPNATVNIIGSHPKGIFYGIQTFLHIVHQDKKANPLQISDCPRFEYRGLHIDSGRNFFGDLYDIINVMSMYKLNKLHLHLTEDEGWRLEIPGLEELTEVGAHRCHDPSGTDCIYPQLGSHPDKNSSGSGSGFFTVEDYKQLLEFANDRHIEVIPEFDMPGHCHAAIKAMEARYRKYINVSEEMATEYRLIDPHDTSFYISAQHYTDNAINPCIESTYNFVQHIAQEIQKMHADIQPLRIFHYGGDEVPEGAWMNSSFCQELLEENPGLSLKEYFAERVANITHELGLGLGAWEDGLMADSETGGNSTMERTRLPNDEVLVHAWNNVWDRGNGGRAYIFANGGFSTVLSSATHLYFDHPSEPDPEERGYYWATRFIDTEKTYGFMPDTMYDNMKIDRFGRELDKEQICWQFGCPPLEKIDNIKGIQAQLFSETVREKDEMESMIFPRFFALAERAWHKANWEEITDKEAKQKKQLDDWKTFAAQLGNVEFSKLEEMGIAYHLRPPGLRINKDKIEASAEFPGLQIKISLDGGTSWQDYKSPVNIPSDTDSIMAYVNSKNGKRKSRTVIINLSNDSSNMVSMSIFTMLSLTWINMWWHF